MRNDTDIAPVLRFGGYNESWHENHLSDLIQLIESGWSPQCATEPAGEHQWGVLRTTSVSWDCFDDSENKRLPDGLEPRTEIEVTTGDILVTRAGPSDRVGVVAYVRRTRPKIMLSDKLIRLRVKALHCPDFIARCLGSQQAQDQLKGQKSGLAKSQTNISQQGLLAVRLVAPTLPEQQKIAAFLTAVDGRIQQLRQKKALLADYKKGVMQQLFTQTLRFHDDHGHDFPDWEEKPLGSVATLVNGRAYKQNELLSEGPYPVLRVGNFFSNPEWYYSDLELPKDKYCDTGDLLYAWSASFGPRIWKGGKVIYHYHIWKVLPSKLVDKNYLFHFMDWDTERIKRAQSSGAVMLHVTKQSMEERPMPVPSLPEQTKIAGFLSALDGKIGAVGEQMRQTQAWKKGLLQQMFV